MTIVLWTATRNLIIDSDKYKHIWQERILQTGKIPGYLLKVSVNQWWRLTDIMGLFQNFPRASPHGFPQPRVPVLASKKRRHTCASLQWLSLWCSQPLRRSTNFSIFILLDISVAHEALLSCFYAFLDFHYILHFLVFFPPLLTHPSGLLYDLLYVCPFLKCLCSLGSTSHFCTLLIQFHLKYIPKYIV